MSKNFYVMERGWMDHDVFPKVPHTEREAFLYLIENASWKKREFFVGNVKYNLERGQLTASIRYLAKAWQWNKNKVSAFLKALESEEMIGTDNGTGQTIITICNYEKFQDVRKKPGQLPGQGRDSKNPDLGQQSGQQIDEENSSIPPENKCGDENDGTATPEIFGTKQTNIKQTNINNIGHLELETLFLEFWDIWPVKSKRKDALTEYAEALTKTEHEVLIAKAQEYAESVKGQTPNFIAGAAKWLHGERWDETFIVRLQDQEEDEQDRFWKEYYAKQKERELTE